MHVHCITYRTVFLVLLLIARNHYACAEAVMFWQNTGYNVLQVGVLSLRFVLFVKQIIYTFLCRKNQHMQIFHKINADFVLELRFFLNV